MCFSRVNNELTQSNERSDWEGHVCKSSLNGDVISFFFFLLNSAKISTTTAKFFNQSEASVQLENNRKNFHNNRFPKGTLLLLLTRQAPFLRAVLREADANKRKQLLQLANANQINTLSELTLNVLKGNVPRSRYTIERL